MIRPYTPRHNGKVERSHREDQKRFYSCHSFYSLEDFEKQLATHNRQCQQLAHETPTLAFSYRVRCTICLTNLQGIHI
ncbi:MAG: integrase core domain-containing protein [Oscillospiraceae bacterium]